MEARLKEAAKLGFGRALGPSNAQETGGLPVAGVTRLADAVRRIGDDDWR
jgi:DNA repair protein RadA/Sms